ncbi:uncharacterized protein RAG0_00714 [Rhynchosporium agropyri]|uniref:Uncharacterized protein n=1 Tax=Rhynchosporium agropyri TaxID=914238 RepID=A0A1E1JUB3_9HELO|nr:uncharacterized protein RAG0_00714 [Rhynchosporium agropyri]
MIHCSLFESTQSQEDILMCDQVTAAIPNSCQRLSLHFNKYARAVKPQQYIAKELASAAVTVRPRDDPELSITTLTYTAIGCLSNVVNCPASPQTIVKNTLPKTLTGAETVPTAKGGFVSAIAL